MQANPQKLTYRQEAFTLGNRLHTHSQMETFYKHCETMFLSHSSVDDDDRTARWIKTSLMFRHVSFMENQLGSKAKPKQTLEDKPTLSDMLVYRCVYKDKNPACWGRLCRPRRPNCQRLFHQRAMKKTQAKLKRCAEMCCHYAHGIMTTSLSCSVKLVMSLGGE